MSFCLVFQITLWNVFLAASKLRIFFDEAMKICHYSVFKSCNSMSGTNLGTSTFVSDAYTTKYLSDFRVLCKQGYP